MTQTDSSIAKTGSFDLGDGRSVARFGFGAMRITGNGIWGQPKDKAEAERVLRRAIELGINLIDTADSYGPNVSEEIIAETLHPYPEELVIATKGGLERPGPERWTRNGRPDHLRQACEGSLKRLKLDCIELYQLHAPDPEVPYEESVGALSDLQRAGKIRNIGVSNVGVAQLELARAVVRVVTVQNRYNFVDRDSEDVLDYCERENIGFIPWYPLATGDLLRNKGALASVAERHQASAGQIALAWLLHRSPVMLPIPGTSKVDHLEENVRAADIQLSEEDRKALSGV